jgi:hypothetical protein
MRARSPQHRSLAFSALVASLALGVVPLTAAGALPAATAASAATVQAAKNPDPVGVLVNEIESDVFAAIQPIECDIWQTVSSVPNPGLCGF